MKRLIEILSEESEQQTVPDWPFLFVSFGRLKTDSRLLQFGYKICFVPVHHVTIFYSLVMCLRFSCAREMERNEYMVVLKWFN